MTEKMSFVIVNRFLASSTVTFMLVMCYMESSNDYDILLLIINSSYKNGSVKMLHEIGHALILHTCGLTCDL